MSFLPWAYTGLTQFITCPRQYQAHRVTKEVPFVETAAMRYGNELHKAAELYIRSSSKHVLPKEFEFIKTYLDKLLELPGKRYCELKMGMMIEDRSFQPCDYWEKGTWYRGIADLIIVDADNERAFLVDFKTGKSAQYADTKQMALLAALIFLHFPRVKTIKSMLLFVKAGTVVKSNYTFDDRFKIFAQLNPDLRRLKAAHESGVFNPQPNNFCSKWCAVTSCVHNGGYDG